MPFLASGVLLFDQADRVLLVHQDYGKHLWTTPGGMLEPAESPADAAVREVREELGVDVELVHLVGVYSRHRSARPRIGFLFLGRLPDGAEPAIADPEIDDLGWFRRDTLPEPLAPGLDRVIDDARAGLIGASRTIDDA